MARNVVERLQHAEQAYAKAAQEHIKEDSWELTRTCATLGLAHCDTGSVRHAVVYLEKVALSHSWSSHAAVHANYPILVEVLEALAYIHGMTEEPAKESAMLERLMQLHKKWGNMDGVVWTWTRFADHFLQQGDAKQQAVALGNAQAESGVQEGLAKLVQWRLSREPVARLFMSLLVSDSADHVAGRRTMAGELDLLTALESFRTEFPSLTELQKVERLAQVLEQRHGAESMEFARILVVVAEMRGERGDLSFKEQALSRVLRMQERRFGLDGIYITWTLKGLAHACGQRGKLQRRLDLLRRTLDIQDEELGANHKHAMTTRFFLREVQEELKQAQGGEGRELSGLFGHRAPTNPKVNRFVGEVVLAPDAPAVRTMKPFPLECSGGGACTWRAGGLDVPFYTLRAGASA